MFQCQRLSSVSCRISSRLSQGAPSEIQKHDSLLADLLAGLPSDGICRRPCSSDGRSDHDFAVVGSDDDLVIHPGLWDGPSMPSPKLSPLIVLLVKVGGPGTWWPHGAWSSWCLTADLPTYRPAWPLLPKVHRKEKMMSCPITKFLGEAVTGEYLWLPAWYERAGPSKRRHFR